MADKRLLDYGGDGDGCQPPNHITTLIDIAFNSGNVNEPLYEGQAGIQNILFIVFLLSVPILLCAKSYIMRNQSYDRQDGEDYWFEKTMIHQATETVSKITTYLRPRSQSFVHSESGTQF